MKRRRYISLSGVLLAGLAGCSEDSDETVEEENTPDNNGGNITPERASNTEENELTQEQSPSDTEEDEPTQETEETTTESSPDITIESTELITIEGTYSDDVGAEVVITNDGDAAKSNIQMGVDWLDANGGYIATSSIYGRAIEPGETWNARVTAQYDVDEPEQIEDAETTIADDSPFGEYELYPQNIELTESTLRVSDEEVIVRGVIENNRETSEFLEYVAKVYNADEQIIGMVHDLEEIEGGDSWRFEANPLTYSRDGQVESAKIVPLID